MPVARERLIAPEMLDHAPPDVARASLRDLARINRYLGGYLVVRKMFARLAQPGDSFSVLDVGAASGDMGAAIRRSFPGARVTSLDYKTDHLAQAADPKLVADAFHLPFRPASFDFVFSSLFLHHFTNEQVVELFSSFRCHRPARGAGHRSGSRTAGLLLPPEHALAVRLARHYHQRRPDFGGGGVQEG